MTKRKIAVPVNENEMLDAHFGHCRYFILNEIEDDKILLTEKVNPPPHEPGMLPKWLADQGVTDIIAGGMGQKAINLFNQYSVNVFVGASQLNSTELVNGFLNGTLTFTSNYCDH